MTLRALLASPLGFVIGVTMGALGAGGSLIAIPILVYVAGQSAQEATATSLIIVGAGAVAGAIPHLREGQVRWRAGVAFGLAGVLTAIAGSLLNAMLDEDILLLAFAVVMVGGAVAMVLGADARQASFRPWRFGIRAGAAARVAGLGAAIGFLTGLFGVGGGFVIVPALVLGLGFSMTEAVATSLLVIAMNAASGLIVRIADSGVDWAVALPFAASTLAGVLLGKRLADRTSDRRLTLAFAAVVVAVAVYTAIDSLLNLL
ncbi:MAG: sulfite exporter TauE/SafE family protein [Solirubrobacterales bacterium]